VPSGATHLTAATLGDGGLHAAWACGSSFPLADRDGLAETVMGTTSVPGPLPCFGMAAALLFASSAVQNRPHGPGGCAAWALAASAGVLGRRALIGLAGKTGVVSPGSSGIRFRSLDRRFYAPVGLGLAAGVLGAWR
jgi:hypothetical protein